MSLIHDNAILSYQVNFETETLILKTQYYIGDTCENTDVVFTGYLNHIFYDIASENQNIVFDIEEYPMNRFLEHEFELLEKRNNYCWPLSHKNMDEVINFFQSNAFKVYSIDSSCGLWGFVIAKEMDVVVTPQTI